MAHYTGTATSPHSPEEVWHDLADLRSIADWDPSVKDATLISGTPGRPGARYEIVRGYRDQNATTQLARFAVFCQHATVFAVTDAIFDRAADLWVTGRRGGYPHNDADLIIAATALEHGRVLVTGNTAQFSWIPGLRLDDWRQP